jgi:DNA topoisomerase VI subunit B
MSTPGLARTTFTTSRTLEFFTERELAMQLGVSRERWGLAILKELLDNALDACEQTDRPPVIVVSEDQDTHTLSVHDNGPGLRVETLEKSLDYTVRVSDKAYYVSPSRGQLGNALKCLWALPYVLSGPRQQGRVDVATAGIRYEVRVSVDHIAQQPVLTLTPDPAPEVKSGTTVTIHWPQQATMRRGGGTPLFTFRGHVSSSHTMRCSIPTSPSPT